MAKSNATPAAIDESELYPIRTVATLTGVNSITLRAWERRYGLVRPVRTDGGHRAYSREDIDAIHRILALLGKGMAIGQVRHNLGVHRPRRSRAAGLRSGPWDGYRERLIAAIAQFDESRLEDIYNEVLALYPADVVTREMLRPLLVELGRRWESAVGSIAEEHFFGVFLRNKLGARFHHRARHEDGPGVLAACLPGEYHEVGLLLFALAANERGFRVVMLGADMPLAELPHAAHCSRSRAIVLSGAIEPPPGLLRDELPVLVAAARIPVFVGGPLSVRDRDAITAAGAQALGNDVEHGLKRIGETLRQPRAG